MTRTAAIICLLISLAGVTAAQLILKPRLALLASHWRPGQTVLGMAIHALSDPYLWLGGGIILVGGSCWYLAMTKLPLSLMLPASSIIAPCVSIGAYFFYGESLTASKFCAIAVIVIGVSWLGWLNA